MMIRPRATAHAAIHIIDSCIPHRGSELVLAGINGTTGRGLTIFITHPINCPEHQLAATLFCLEWFRQREVRRITPQQGGIRCGYRDCSGTTKDIFAYFGIWLPRDSAMQKKLGGLDIDLSNLSDSQKQKILLQKAAPFLSLIYMPGHIMIYLGNKDNTLYILHDMWGLRTFRPFQSQGRWIVGKTVITPIDFGKEYWTVEKNLLSKSTDLIILKGYAQ